jgi:hypothetical protein
MTDDNRQFVDGMLVEWGTRLFWPKNKIVKSSSPASPVALHAAIARWKVTPASVRSKVNAAVRRAPQVLVKVSGGGSGMSRIAAHFQYISRNGKLDLEDENGQKVSGKDGLADLKKDWQTGTTWINDESDRREAFNIVLSMPRETDAEIVRAAASAFAKREFANHQYVFVLHKPEIDDKTERPHVHLAVRAEGRDGRRLNPRKSDLQRWREIFSEDLNARGAPARASRRVEHGHLSRGQPGWYKHVRSRGGVVDKLTKPPSQRELDTHKEALESWRGIAMALAKSDIQSDRDTSLAITAMVAKMPSALFLAKGHSLDRTTPVKDREAMDRAD